MAAREKYEISIQEIEHDEKQAQKKADDNAVKSKEHELHKVIHVLELQPDIWNLVCMYFSMCSQCPLFSQLPWITGNRLLELLNVLLIYVKEDRHINPDIFWPRLINYGYFLHWLQVQDTLYVHVFWRHCGRIMSP